MIDDPTPDRPLARQRDLKPAERVGVRSALTVALFGTVCLALIRAAILGFNPDPHHLVAQTQM